MTQPTDTTEIERLLAVAYDGFGLVLVERFSEKTPEQIAAIVDVVNAAPGLLAELKELRAEYATHSCEACGKFGQLVGDDLGRYMCALCWCSRSYSLEQLLTNVGDGRERELKAARAVVETAAVVAEVDSCDNCKVCKFDHAECDCLVAPLRESLAAHAAVAGKAGGE